MIRQKIYPPVGSLQQLEALKLENFTGTTDYKAWNDKLAEEFSVIAVNRHCPYIFQEE